MLVSVTFFADNATKEVVTMSAVTISAVGLLTAAALGQMGQWISEVETDNGDSIVEPGETATVSIWMDLDPSVGDQLPDGLIVRALGGGRFDFVGQMNADKGSITSWERNEHLAIGDEGFTDGVSIFDVEIFQLPGENVDSSDPLLLLEYQWKPNVYDAFTAFYTPFVEVGDDKDGFFVYFANGPTQTWRATERSISIQVIPAPSCLICILGMVVTFGARRQRYQ